MEVASVLEKFNQQAFWAYKRIHDNVMFFVQKSVHTQNSQRPTPRFSGVLGYLFV